MVKKKFGFLTCIFSKTNEQIFVQQDYSADKFHSVYRSFLDDLIVNPVDPNLMKQLDPIYMEIEKIQDRLLEVEMACYNRWTSISDAFRSRYNNDFNQFKKAMCTEFVTLETKSKTLAGQIEYMMKNLSDRKTYLATTATNKYSLHFGTKNWVALNSYESFVNNMRAGLIFFEKKTQKHKNTQFDDIFQVKLLRFQLKLINTLHLSLNHSTERQVVSI